MDTGPILVQETLPIDPAWTSVELADALGTQAARLIVDALTRLDALSPTPQDEAHATHAPMLVKEDGFVRWTDSAAQIVNRFRGVAAWPQTTAFLNGARIKLGGLSVTAGQGQPGEVLRVDDSGVTVAATTGAVLIQTAQPEARRAQPAHVWAQGAGVGAGTHLDVWEPPTS